MRIKVATYLTFGKSYPNAPPSKKEIAFHSYYNLIFKQAQHDYDVTWPVILFDPNVI